MGGKKTLFIALLAITLLQVIVIVRGQVTLITPTANPVNLAIGNGDAGRVNNLLDDTEGSGSDLGDDEESGESEDSVENKEEDNTKRDEQQQNFVFEERAEYPPETAVSANLPLASTTVSVNPPLASTTVNANPLLESTTIKAVLDTSANVDEGVPSTVETPTTSSTTASTITGATTEISKQEVCKNCSEVRQEDVKGEHETCGKVLENVEGISVILQRISEQGIEGPAGQKGSKGAMGERGTPGSVMYKGQKGIKGDSLPGAIGPMGPIGSPGMPGAKGDRGPVGPEGLHGQKGESIVGPPGLPGEKGECIMKKIPGPPGLPGPAGMNIQLFENLYEMYKMEKLTTPGSLAYVRETGKFYGRTKLGWGTLLMYQSKRPGSSFKDAKTEQSALQTRRPKQLVTQQKQNGDGVGGKSQIYNNDPPVMTNTSVKPTTEQASNVSLNQTLVQTPTQLRLIALNSPWSGNMNGIDFINYQCQKEAMDSNLNGIFRAFLSTTGVDLTSLIHNRDDKIVNIHNHTLYESKRLLFRTGRKFFEDKLDKQVDWKESLYSFDGRHVILDDKWEINMLWHGAQMGGRYSSQNCQDWTSNSSDNKGIASDFLFRYILDQQLERCSDGFIVLCIELSPLIFQEYLDTRPLEFVEQQKAVPTNAGKPPPSLFIGENEYQQFLKAYYEL